MYSKESDKFIKAFLRLGALLNNMFTPEEIQKYFRDRAEGKLQVKERKVFLCKELKNIKLNEN